MALNYAYNDDGRQTQTADSFVGTQTSLYDLGNQLVRRTYEDPISTVRLREYA